MHLRICILVLIVEHLFILLYTSLSFVHHHWSHKSFILILFKAKSIKVKIPHRLSVQNPWSLTSSILIVLSIQNLPSPLSTKSPVIISEQKSSVHFWAQHLHLLSSQSSVPISLQKSTMHPPSLKFTTLLLSTTFYIHLKNPPLSFWIHETLFEYKSLWVFVTQCFTDLLIKDFYRTAQTLLASHSLASQTFSAIVSCSGKPFHSL